MPRESRGKFKTLIYTVYLVTNICSRLTFKDMLGPGGPYCIKCKPSRVDLTGDDD